MNDPQFYLLAGLLHDIWKVKQREVAEVQGKYVSKDEIIESFLNELKGKIAFLSALKKDVFLKIIDMCKNLEKYSEMKTANELTSELPDFEESKKPEILAKSRLSPVFMLDELNIYKTARGEKVYYVLSPLKVFKEKFWTSEIKGSYGELVKEFITFLNKYGNYIQNVETLDFVLAKYLWSVPSVAKENFISTTSLYYHLKLTGAFSSCFAESKSENVYLVYGDVSGIQRFISNVVRILETELKGMAKRLRGRSSYIDILLYSIALGLLNFFDIGITHIIYIGGGNFLLAIPETTMVEDKLRFFEKKIQDYFAGVMKAEIGMVLAWKRVTAKDIREKGGKIIGEINDILLPEKKLRKLCSATAIYKVIPETKLGEGESLCRACGIRISTDETRLCDICKKLQEFGELIAKAEEGKAAIVFAILKRTAPAFEKLKEIYHDPIKIREDFIISAYLALDVRDPITIEEIKELSKNAHKVYILMIRNMDNFIITEIFPKNVVFGWIVINKHVPMEDGRILSLDEIAEKRRKGPKYLAYVKMDLDYSGLMISRLPTIAHYASYSLAVDAFFSMYVPSILMKYRDIYVVFGGGDDLFFIGPWDIAINAIIEINKDFEELCSKIATLSAGYIMIRPKIPIKIGYELALEAIDSAKPSKDDPIGGKIMIFSTRVNMIELEKLINYGELLRNLIEKGEISRTLVMRLLEIRRKTFKGQGKIDVTWWPKVLYALRELAKKRPDVARMFLNFCQNTEGFRKIIIPLSYALLATRKT